MPTAVSLEGSTALITGGAGLIGSTIADQLVDAGAERIIVIDNMTRGRLANIQAARAQYHSQRASLFPHIDASASKSRSRSLNPYAGTGQSAFTMENDSVELGVSSFGMQVLNLPPNSGDGYPNHDHAESGQEEVYIVLEGAADFDIEGEAVHLGPKMALRVGAGTETLVNQDRVESLARLAAVGTPERWTRCLDALLLARRRLDANANTALVTEVLMMRLLRE